MKHKINVSINDLLKVFENISDFAKELDISSDNYGIIVTKKKGLARSIEEKLWLTFSIVKLNNEYVVIFRLSGSIEPIARAKVKSISSGCEISTECLGDKDVCSHIDKMFKNLAKNTGTVIERLSKRAKASEAILAKFSLSSKYAKVIDGLAEVTLSSLYLKYPLLERRKMKLNDIKNLNEFLDNLYRKYVSTVREVYVHVSNTNWMFILAVDLENMVYTPSFIEDTLRVVGKGALEKLMEKQDEYVVVSILTMHS